LRRDFPALEPGREDLLRERNRVALEDDPRRAELERRLLDLGGRMALLFLPDLQIGELLARGRYFPGARALMRLGAPSGCHGNVAMLHIESRGEVRIAQGYALSDDGLWRQHSWGVDAEDGRVLETTDRRVRYFGLVLNDAEVAMRLLEVIRSGHLWPEEVEEVREVLLKVYRLPVELVDLADRGMAEGPARGRS
jgi:hypothetical protein